jgi:galactokinase
MKVEELMAEFGQIFPDNSNDTIVFFAPGRINLIGEHTDYNGGLVMPMALTTGTYLVTAPNNHKLLRFHAAGFKPDYSHPLFSDTGIGRQNWYKYPMGLVDWFVNRYGWLSQGWDFYFSGDLPLSAGLSSSASIEMVTAIALDTIFQTNLPLIDLVRAAQNAENEFVGVKCGILDMFASGMGRADHCMLIDCQTLNFRTVPFHLEPLKIVIMNTNLKRGLAGSKYNERVAECNNALEILKLHYNIHTLSDIPFDNLNESLGLLNDHILKKRIRHILTENERVRYAGKALDEKNLEWLGELMQASHDSLRDDYEVTGIELDTLVMAALEFPGVTGARMTGAGFGGCAIALVPEDRLQDFIQHTGNIYTAKLNRTASFYMATAGEGARRII